MKTKRACHILYFFTIAFFAVFYYFLPFSGDDWTWGSEFGMVRLRNAFDGYNGRYLGNLLIMLVTRSAIAKIILCTSIMFLLVYLLSRIFDGIRDSGKSAVNYMIAFCAVLLLVLPNRITFGNLQPFQIFGSTVGWLSGFTNYVVPSVLILAYYFLVTCRKYETVAVFVMLFFDGILSCLCVEHYTLFCLVFSFSVIVYRYVKKRTICRKSVSFLAGSLIGATIMFSNSSYRLMQKGNTSENLRSVGFMGSLRNYARFIFPKNTDGSIIILFEASLLILLAAIIVVLIWRTCRAFRNKTLSAFLPVICMVVMTLPLLFTNSGKEIYIVCPRCYFLQYFMLVVYLYKKFSDKHTESPMLSYNGFVRGLKISFAVLLLVTCVQYGVLDYYGIVRDSRVEEALEKGYSTVEIIEYPKSAARVQWASNFLELDIYITKYRKFKNIPDDMDVVFRKIQ